MKTSQKQLLVAALSVAFASKINAETIDANPSISDYAPMKQEDGKWTIFAGPAIRTEFERVEGLDSQHADITFEVQFIGCTYDKELDKFLWDGAEYELVFGNYNDNLILAVGDKPVEDDWFESVGTLDIDELEDTEITKAVLVPLFANMDKDIKSQFLMAVFNQVIKGTPKPE